VTYLGIAPCDGASGGGCAHLRVASVSLCGQCCFAWPLPLLARAPTNLKRYGCNVTYSISSTTCFASSERGRSRSLHAKLSIRLATARETNPSPFGMYNSSQCTLAQFSP